MTSMMNGRRPRASKSDCAVSRASRRTCCASDDEAAETEDLVEPFANLDWVVDGAVPPSSLPLALRSPLPQSLLRLILRESL